MRRTWITALAALGIGLFSPGARAADHTDGPQASTDSAADITDLFTWMSPDASKLYLVLDVNKAATATSKFSNTVKYAFHVNSHPGILMPAKDKTDVICTFDATQKIQCWVYDKVNKKTLDYLAPTDASATAGVMSTGGKMKVFAGLRDDPFFFNLTGLTDLEKFVHDNVSMLPTPDATGCIALDMKTSQTAVAVLSHQGTGTMPPKDDFGKLNVLSIVIALDKTLVTSTGNTLVGVWAGTYK